MLIEKPNNWFRSVHESSEDVCVEPNQIEYLKMWTGETFIHTGGTAFWASEGNSEYLDIKALLVSGITHYRILDR